MTAREHFEAMRVQDGLNRRTFLKTSANGFGAMALGSLLSGESGGATLVPHNAKAKRARKGADWIVANDVADTGRGSVMGGDRNRVHIVTKDGVETLDEMPKQDVARELVRRAAAVLEEAHD